MSATPPRDELRSSGVSRRDVQAKEAGGSSLSSAPAPPSPHHNTRTATEHCDVASSSDDYAQRFEGAVGRWMLAVQAEAVLRLLQPWRGGTVLDVGGGHAQLAGPLMEADHPVTILGSDAVCAQRPRRLCPDARFVCGDLVELPFADQSFDVVTAVRMLAHVQRWEAMVAEMCRVARHAVVVDFATPVSVNAVAPLLFSLKKIVEQNTRAYQMQTRGQVQRAFAAAGFTHTQSVGQFGAPMAMHRMLNAPSLSRGTEAVLGAVGVRALLGAPVVMCATRRG